jgi:hypothetical protein
VAPPTSFTVTQDTPDDFQLQIAGATELGDAEFLSGPTTIGPAIVLVGSGGRVLFLRLAENSSYTFRYRNKIFVESTNSLIVSEWVTFAFRTPTFDSLRPIAPQNLRVVARTDTMVTVRWDAGPTPVTYQFTLNGAAPVNTVCNNPLFCEVPDPLTYTFARPPVGTSVLFSVVAIAPPRITPLCTPYCFPDERFTDSFPSTLRITNS